MVMMINSISPRVDNTQHDSFFPVKTECRVGVKPIMQFCLSKTTDTSDAFQIFINTHNKLKILFRILFYIVFKVKIFILRIIIFK